MGSIGNPDLICLDYQHHWKDRLDACPKRKQDVWILHRILYYSCLEEIIGINQRMLHLVIIWYFSPHQKHLA